MAVYKTKSAQETVALGQKLGESLNKGALILFTGDLGSGKTAFCTGLAKGLCCTDIISSPTFSIVNVYSTGKLKFAHFDLYRVFTQEDLETCGFYDYLDEGAVVAAEWSENIAHIVKNEDAVRVDFKITGEQEREITIENGGTL